MDADTEEDVSKAEELAKGYCYANNGRCDGITLEILLEQYGRLVQEAAAESLRRFESAPGDDPAFIGGITKYAPKIIERMPLP